MIKDQFRLFLKVLISFGHLYFAVNVLLLTEILEHNFHATHRYQPSMLIEKYFESSHYIPGSATEITMRVLGVVLLLAALHLNWTIYTKPYQLWKKTFTVNLFLLSGFFVWVLYQGITVNILYNSIGFALSNIIVLLWIGSKRKVTY